MPRATIYVLTQAKGGTAKTSSSVNIAAVLAKKYRVLAVDMDQQASFTLSLGVNPIERTHTVRHLLVEPEVRAEDVIVSTSEPGIDLIPANVDLAMVEFSMPPMGRERMLAKKLAPVLDRYGAIIIDTPPSFSITTLNALACADFALVPVQPEPLCLYGLSQFRQVLESVKDNSNPGLKLLGLFLTLYDSRIRFHKEIAEQLRQDWGEQVLHTIIRKRSNILESSVYGRSMISHNPNSDLAEDYVALTEEILNRVQQIQQKKL